MTPEQRLHAALDAAPAPVRFWWRDDDAGRDHPRLAALLRIGRARAPLRWRLAVVPDWLKQACADRVRGCRDMHRPSARHRSHRPCRPGRPRRSSSAGRPTATAAPGPGGGGADWLAADSATNFCRCWCRRGTASRPNSSPRCPRWGYHGLSVYGRRASAEPVPGLRLLEHPFRPDRLARRQPAADLAEAVERLVALIGSGLDEPIGILSHHLVMDAAAFATLDRLLALVQDHPQAELASAGALFREGR